MNGQRAPFTLTCTHRANCCANANQTKGIVLWHSKRDLTNRSLSFSHRTSNDLESVVQRIHATPVKILPSTIWGVVVALCGNTTIVEGLSTRSGYHILIKIGISSVKIFCIQQNIWNNVFLVFKLPGKIRRIKWEKSRNHKI